MKSKCIVFAFILQASFLYSLTAQWVDTMTPGDWNVGANWSSAPMFPGVATGDEANLTNTSPPLPSSPVINLQVPLTLGTINFDLGTGYTLNPGAAGTFTFSASGGNSGLILVTTTNGNGSHTITAPIILTSSNLQVTQGSTGNFLISGKISGTGSLTTNGTQTLLLNNPGLDNSYSGGTFIQSGTLGIPNDSQLGATPATVSVTITSGILQLNGTFPSSRLISLAGGAEIDVTGAFTPTLSGVISGAGSLTKGSTGTLTLSGINLYTGGTTIAAGALSISNDNNLGNTSGALNIGNSGAGTATLITTAGVTSARSGTFTGSAVINTSGVTDTFTGVFRDGSAAGSLTVNGGGSLILTGANSYSGGTTVTGAGTILQGNTNGLQGNITANVGTFVKFIQNFDATYSGVLSGSGTLNIGGPGGGGAVTFSANSSGFTGPTNITTGSFIVNGSIANSSLVTLSSGATLSGTGTVGTTSSLGGTLDPGSGSTIGTLSINGTLTQNGASHTNINLAPIVGDKIAVSGTATIAGSLTIDPTPGFYGFSADYTILTSSGLAGTFSAPANTTNSAFQPTVTYTATNVLLHVLITQPFALFPFSNFNTAAVGNNIDALYAAGQLSTDLFNVFNTFIGQSFDVINNALDQMHPAPYSAFTEMQAELSGQLLSLFHRLPYLPCSCSNPNRLWIEPFGNSLTMKRKGLEIGFQANTGGLALGYDGQILENLILGLGGAWNKSHLEWHDHRGHGDVNGLYGGIYFDSQFGSFYLGGSFLAGMDFYDTSRHLDFLTTNRHAKANYQALDIMAQMRTAYLFGSPQAFFYPYGNLDYLYLHTYPFSETGAEGLDLSVRGYTNGTLRTEMGLGLQVQDRNAAETMCISPLVSLGWVNMAPLERPLLKSTFAGASIPFAVRGWDETWNLLNVRFGLSISYFCFSLSLNYNAEISPNDDTTLFNQHGDFRLDWKW